MEKPTGVIQKIIESLQQVNALDVYSSIEKDIILHNLRAAYMIFLNIPVSDQNDESRLEKLFVEEIVIEKNEVENVETTVEEEVIVEDETVGDGVVEENTIEEEVVEDESIEDESIEDESIEDEIVETKIFEDEIIEFPVVAEDTIIEETTYIPEPEPNVAPTILHDDIREFIPDAQPQATLLFNDMEIPKLEKKSLNDLLIEKKDDNSLGTKFQQTNIPDLTKAIALNEKFTFIRELFHNSGGDFSATIQKLNECENIDSAFVLMEELKHQYLWNTTSTSYLSLCDLVRRRFL